MKFIDHLINTYFSNDKNLYSPVYIAGIYEALLAVLEEREEKIPYQPGSVEGDAFISGLVEGHAVWQQRRNIELKRFGRQESLGEINDEA